MFYILTSGNLLVNKTDLQATLVGPTATGPVQDSLAVTRLENQHV